MKFQRVWNFGIFKGFGEVQGILLYPGVEYISYAYGIMSSWTYSSESKEMVVKKIKWKVIQPPTQMSAEKSDQAAQGFI